MVYEEKFRVYYEDTDTMGIVYHANYLKFADRARTNLLVSEFFKKTDEGYVVVSIKINYIKSAKLMDLITVKTEFKQINRCSIEVWQPIYRDKQLLCNVDIRLGYVKIENSSFKLTRIPNDYIAKLTKYVKKD